MIPSARLRAIRKAGGTPTPPSFDKAVSSGYSSNTGSLSVVVANNGSTVFGTVVGNDASLSACTFNGVAGTLIGSVKTSGRNYVFLYKWENVNAGTYNLAATSSGSSWIAIAASVFYNVTSIGVATTNTGTSATMPTGTSSDITLSAFGGVSALTVTSGTQATKAINDDKSVAMVYSSSDAAAHTVTNGQGSVSIKIAGPLVSFARQRMNKVGTNTASTSSSIVTGWASDASYPANVVSNQLVVSGNRAGATVFASVYQGSAANNSGSIGLYKNGALIGSTITFSSSITTRTITATTDVVSGDVIEMRSSSAYTGRIYENTYLEVS